MKWLDALARWWLGRHAAPSDDDERWRVRMGHILADWMTGTEGPRG